MAIYKGQLMNQETKDILYPQTSTDMVDGLEELLEHNPKQLLINPDFQINQRGQSEYTTTAIDRINTVDMWGIIASNTTTKLTVLDKGVKLENQGTGVSVLTQRINIEKVSNYTVVLKVNNIVGNVICEIYHIGGIYGTYTLKNGINVIEIKNSSFNDVSPTINGQGSAEFEYINLFEGDIAYPHVKNKYEYDLIECQRKIRYVYGTAPVPGYRNGNLAQYFLCCYIGMDSVPNVVDSNCAIGNIGLISAIPTVLVSEDGKYITVMNISHSLIGSSNLQASDASYRLEFTLLLSCEPL